MRFACSILVLGHPVMCDTVEAADAATARADREAKFWRDPDEFRASIATMDDDNRRFAVRMLELMEASRAEARKWGITVTARASRAKH